MQKRCSSTISPKNTGPFSYRIVNHRSRRYPHHELLLRRSNLDLGALASLIDSRLLHYFQFRYKMHPATAAAILLFNTSFSFIQPATPSRLSLLPSHPAAIRFHDFVFPRDRPFIHSIVLGVRLPRSLCSAAISTPLRAYCSILSRPCPYCICISKLRHPPAFVRASIRTFVPPPPRIQRSLPYITTTHCFFDYTPQCVSTSRSHSPL